MRILSSEELHCFGFFLAKVNHATDGVRVTYDTCCGESHVNCPTTRWKRIVHFSPLQFPCMFEWLWSTWARASKLCRQLHSVFDFGASGPTDGICFKWNLGRVPTVRPRKTLFDWWCTHISWSSLSRIATHKVNIEDVWKWWDNSLRQENAFITKFQWTVYIPHMNTWMRIYIHDNGHWVS